jgi:hypothetical protein
VLVIKPAYDLSLKEGLTSGSLTNSNFFVKLGGINQSSEAISPELIIMFKYNGIWTNMAGVSSKQLGYLEKDDVLSVKIDDQPHIFSDDIEQEFGGKLHRPLHRLLNKRNMKSRLDEKKAEGAGMAAGLPSPAMMSASAIDRHIRR